MVMYDPMAQESFLPFSQSAPNPNFQLAEGTAQARRFQKFAIVDRLSKCSTGDAQLRNLGGPSSVVVSSSEALTNADVGGL